MRKKNNERYGHFFSILFLVVVVTFLTNSGTESEAGEVFIKMDKGKFIPRTITISSGDKVTWVEVDDNTHHTRSGKTKNSNDSGKEWHSPVMLPGETFSHIFTKAGEYDYTCPMHFMANYGEKEGMVGTIIVKDGHKVNYADFSKPRVSADSKADIFFQVKVLKVDYKKRNLQVQHAHGRKFVFNIPKTKGWDATLRRVFPGREIQIRAGRSEKQYIPKQIVIATLPFLRSYVN
tara:strand:- start:11866 stop:12567 length:702 start_codon:yes stop_codon:yes gene_type:complete